MSRQASSPVVITGVGMVTPLGLTVKESWENACLGVSGLSSMPNNYRQGCSSPAVGLVSGEQQALEALLTRKEISQTDRFVHLALIAGSEALCNSGLLSYDNWDRSCTGVYAGVGFGGLKSIADAVLRADKYGESKVSPFVIPRIISNQAAGWLSKKFQLQGGVAGLSVACSSGTDAIGLAFRAVRDGYAPVMLAGGSESCITPLSLAAFNNMRALSSWNGDPTAASRPFDKHRSGFVMAEGSGFVVLEREDHARQRGASIYARLVGYGTASDAYHVAAMHPDGVGARLAMSRALDDAELVPEDVDYINAHGTGTLMNDRIEAKAIQSLFPHAEKSRMRSQLLVSSTKSMTGHLLGGAGGVETVFSALSLHYDIVLPTINCDEQDPEVKLDCLLHHARSSSIRIALSNSFGFGGGCSVLALQKYEKYS